MAEGHGDGSRDAPGELALVQAFVNTADLEDGRDDIADPAGLRAWLREHHLAARGVSFNRDDVERATAFREALRMLLLSHHGAQVDRDAVAALEEAAAQAPLVVAFAPDGATRLEPAGGGVDAAFARLLAIIARAEAEGTWSRMKACPAENCRWAFYDHSRNRSRTWCEMSVCGNRAKARSFRRRSARRGEG